MADAHEHENAALAELHRQLHDVEAKTTKFQQTLIRHQLAQRHRQEYTEYCLKHGLRGKPNLADEVAELLASLVASAVRLALQIPYVIIATWMAYLLSEILLFTVHDVIYLSFHDVIEPLRYAVSKAIDFVFGLVGGVIESIINSVEKAGAKAVNWITKAFTGGHGTHIKPKTLHLPNPILPLQQSQLGALYPAVVNMKRLCQHATHAGLHVVHLALQVLTGGTLCQLVRQIWPSPLLRWVGDLLYGDSFVDPHGANCRAHVITAVCLAWNLNVLVWVFYRGYLVIVVLRCVWPTLSLLWRVWYANWMAALYVVWQRRLTAWPAAWEHHMNKHARFRSQIDHLDHARGVKTLDAAALAQPS